MKSQEVNTGWRQRELTNAELVNKESFDRLKSKNHHKRIRRAIFYLFTALFLCAVFAFICVFFFFKARNIETEGNMIYSSEDIISACGFEEEPNLYILKESLIESNIIAKFPYVNNVSFKRVLPSTLILVIDEDKPAYCIDIENEYFVLSAELRVIDRFGSLEEAMSLGPSIMHMDLPLVSYAVVGRTIRFWDDLDFDYIIKFISDLKACGFYEQVDFIDASDKYHIILYIEDGRYKIILGDNTDTETKIEFVNAVIADSFNDTTIAQINVEYTDRIIVTYEEQLFSY